MMPTLLHLELRRALRNRRTLVFAAVLPMVSFATFSSGANGQVGGLDVAPYVMVGMATYGAINALFNGGGLIAAEPAVGWNRQLRIAGLSGRVYVATKALTCYLTALPGTTCRLRARGAGAPRRPRVGPVGAGGRGHPARTGAGGRAWDRDWLLRPPADTATAVQHGSALLALLGGCGCQRRPSLMWYRT